ncbi:MAG: Minf_1886 family protein [Verrucomicrobiota bacterium]|nr:Minf_1886 family protein [Verrucomicrobiota bacterium]
MSDKNFPEVIKEIHASDPRYGKGAYYFIREALDHTLKKLKKDQSKNKGHVSGTQLLDGIRDYALDRFGPMTLTLMEHWNIQKCRDFGDIVFNLVDFGILGRTENDSLEDFEGGYSFEEAFELPFQPKNLEKN